MDYVAMTDRFGSLDFSEFIELWEHASAIAEAEVEASLNPRHDELCPSRKKPA